MALRPPSHFSGASTSDVLFDALGHEIIAEKAAALGTAGRKAEECLARLRDHGNITGVEGDDALRQTLLKDAADAVYAWFIQRELCGLRRHDAVIRDLEIPREILARLGAR